MELLYRILILQGSQNMVKSIAEIVSKCRSNYVLICSSDITLDIVKCEKEM